MGTRDEVTEGQAAVVAWGCLNGRSRGADSTGMENRERKCKPHKEDPVERSLASREWHTGRELMNSVGSLLHCLVWKGLGLELRALPALTQSQGFHPGALDLHKPVFSPIK